MDKKGLNAAVKQLSKTEAPSLAREADEAGMGLDEWLCTRIMNTYFKKTGEAPEVLNPNGITAAVKAVWDFSAAPGATRGPVAGAIIHSGNKKAYQGSCECVVTAYLSAPKPFVVPTVQGVGRVGF